MSNEREITFLLKRKVEIDAKNALTNNLNDYNRWIADAIEALLRATKKKDE